MTSGGHSRPESAARIQHPNTRLLDALVVVGSDLDLDAVLRRIVENAMHLVGARYGALGVLGDAAESAGPRRLSRFVPAGLSEDDEAAIGRWPHGEGVLSVLIDDPRPLRLDDLATHPRHRGFPAGHPRMRSFLGIPVRVHDDVYGTLYLADKAGGAVFDADDEAVVSALASAAGVAIENARLYQEARHSEARLQASAAALAESHAEAERVSVLEDRDRIARDLHDVVIQRLFASAMTLMSTVRLVDHPIAAARIRDTVDDLDATIRQIRSTVFAMRAGADGNSASLRAGVLRAVESAAPILGFTPGVEVDGSIDALVPPAIADQVILVLTEALADVARRPGARRVTVSLTTNDHLVLTVVDDGENTGDPMPGGLRTIEERAHALGGVLTVEAASPTGTRLRWQVPLSRSVARE